MQAIKSDSKIYNWFNLTHSIFVEVIWCIYTCVLGVHILSTLGASCLLPLCGYPPQLLWLQRKSLIHGYQSTNSYQCLHLHLSSIAFHHEHFHR